MIGEAKVRLKRKFDESGRGAERARCQRDRGGTLVEFAVVAPLLFLLLFGVIEFARVGHGFSTVWTAAREGAANRRK